MLAIRLSRTGKIHAPHYRIVVQERRSKLNGKTVDVIGHYHPAQANKLLVVNKEKAELWLGRGAQPSDTVTNLLVKEGILGKEKKVHSFFTPTKKEDKKSKEEKIEKAAEVTTEETVEETSEETPAETETPEETPAGEAAAKEVVTEETLEAAEETPEADSTEEEPAKE